MRLIDADALKKEVDNFQNCYNGWSDTYDKSFIIGAIEEQPSIEAVPLEYHNKVCEEMARRHQAEILELTADRPQGEWKPKNHHTDYCSNCGFEETQWRTADYNFCPSCGAIMKGSDDEYDK